MVHREVTSRESVREKKTQKDSIVDSEVVQMIRHGFDSISHNDRK